MTVSPPAGVGAALRRTRESRGISLHEIAAATKLSRAALEAIERDDVSRLPGGRAATAYPGVPRVGLALWSVDEDAWE